MHFVCNDKGETVSFFFPPGNTDDRSVEVFNVLKKKLFGKLFGDSGYISASLFEMLFNGGIHTVTGIKSNMKNRPMTLKDNILLRKRAVIETVNDELKNICDIEHSRHRSILNFFMNLTAAPGAYCFFDKKPAIKLDFEPDTAQLAGI
ncbi:MAG: transposase [Prevotellaceae bacterium]|nr:transposase [Prevotellaceae bacterium]